LKLGGEGGLAQRLPCHGGDAVNVGAVVGREAGTSGVPGRVRRSEQLGGPVGPACQRLRAGQAG
jgi:hypothetical protein